MERIVMASATDLLNRYIITDGATGKESLFVDEAAFKGRVPRAIYSKAFYEVHLPFLRLYSFPCEGIPLGTLGTNLTVFEAVGNYISNLPDDFSACRHLKKIDLSFNHLNEISSAIFDLSKLEDLNLQHNYIKFIDKRIASLKNLKILNLGGNLLIDVPDELRKCKSIKKLNLSGKFYAESRSHLESFPECVCHLNNLIQLDLSWQQVSQIPANIGHLKKLEVLNLKWNQLVHISPELRKCSRLKSVDLSGALRMRSIIPDALLCLEDVQSLNLSDNFFTEVSSEVCGLVKINTLIAQRNSLLFLTPEVYKLRYLEFLELNQNFLKTLPPGIRHLKRLRYLSLDNNSLTQLPDEICELENLNHLTLGNNQVTELPESIVQLSNLEYLNVEKNNLTEIPLLMDRLEKLAESDNFYINDNNLRSPFREISEQGTKALFDFLKGVRVKEARHRWKLILIGAAHAGKTSLRRALMEKRSNLTDPEERTWVMERHLWEPESRLRVQVLDFGGHHIYQAAHHMFLSSDAFHVLVFDLAKYTTELFHELIGHWLDAIMDRASGATIVIVGTHCDLCSKEDIEEKKEDVLRLMKRNEARRLNQLKKEIRKITEQLVNPQGHSIGGIGRTAIPEIGEGRLQQKLNSLQKMLNTRSKIPEDIYIVSCAGELTGLDDFRSSIIDILKANQSSEMPDQWFSFLECLQKSSDENVVLFNDALKIYAKIMQDSPLSVGVGGSPERSLEVVLKYLHSTGEIVWYPDNEQLRTTIFHRPEKLIDMLRSVFRHDFDKAVTYETETAEITSLQLSQFDKSKRDFMKRGLMTREFMKYLLVHMDLSEDGSDSFINLILSLMLKFNLCFEVINVNTKALLGSSLVVQFPWFFPVEEPAGLWSKWRARLPSNTFELSMEIVFPADCPPNFFEKLSVKFHDFLSESDRDNWKAGVLAQKNSSTLLVRKERRDQSTVIAASVRGKDNLSELWSLLKDVRRSALLLFPDWPMLKCDFYLVCMHCVLKGIDEPYRYPGDVLDTAPPRGVYHKKCCDKSPEDNIPTSFVFPLDEPVYPEDRAIHYQHMKSAIDFLQGINGNGSGYDSVDASPYKPPCVLSDKLFSLLAIRLGSKFEMVALQLAIPLEQIEMAQRDYPHNTFRQILEVFKVWRDGRNDDDCDDDDADSGNADDNEDNGDDGKAKLKDLLDVLSSDEIGLLSLRDEILDKFCLDL